MFAEPNSMKEEDITSDCDDISPRNWDDHNIKVYEQKSYESSTDDEGIPVQCTEDLPEKKHLNPESEQVKDPDIVEIDESIDLPLNAVRNQEFGSENRINISKLNVNTLDQLTDDSTLVKDNELQLQLKPKPECETDRKLTSADEDENVDSSELKVMRYLRPLSRQKTHQGIQVYMLHVQRYPACVAEKQPVKDPTFPDCRTEMNRLKTYVNFPSAFPIFVIKLARDGFIYRQEYDSVECYFCRLRLPLEELSQPGMNFDQLHREKAPCCPFKRGEDCGNEPVPTGEQFKHLLKEPSSSNMSTVDKFSANRSTGVTSSTEVASRNEKESSVANNVPHQSGSPAEVYQPDAVALPQSASVQQPAAVRRDTVVTDSVRTAGQPVRRDAVVTDSVPTVAQPASSASASGAANNKSKPNSKRNKNKSSGAAASASENTRTTNSNASRSTNSNRKASSSNTNSTASKPSTQDASTSSNNTPEGNGEAPQKLTYADLGIFSEKPKRADMVVMQKRLSSFVGKWKDTHKQTPEMLAAAGMYYAGYSDCARCFFCGGGLKNWDPPDNPWIEHARWFPKCAYLRLVKGSTFVDIVQRKNNDKEPMTLKQVEDEVKLKTERSLNAFEGKSPVAVSANSGVTKGTSAAMAGGASDGTTLRALEAENEELKTQTACKICMDEESTVVFLPCGHLVACTHCAIALKNCPLCRAEIKGSVRAHMA